MFSTLESTWDQSARQGRATLVSFAMQALALSLLLAIPLLTIQGPPKLHWFDESPILTPPPAPAPPREDRTQFTLRTSTKADNCWRLQRFRQPSRS